MRYGADGFWDVVAEKYWEREPFAFEFSGDDAPFTVESVFEALAADCEHDQLDWLHLSVSDSPSQVRDYRPLSFRHSGPNSSDDNWLAYFERMSGKEFGMNVHDLGRRNPSLQPVAQAFAEHLSHVPGAPVPRTWELDSFSGTYRATPFGIHRDNASVFSFGLIGRRRVLLWDPDYFEPGHPDLTKPDPEIIAKHEPNATTLQIEPGRGGYWPSGYWHVVLSDGEPFAVAQASAYFNQADLGR